MTSLSDMLKNSRWSYRNRFIRTERFAKMFMDADSEMAGGLAIIGSTAATTLVFIYNV